MPHRIEHGTHHEVEYARGWFPAGMDVKFGRGKERHLGLEDAILEGCTSFGGAEINGE